MELSLSEQLKQTFDVVSLRHEAKKLPAGEDWERANEIRTAYAEANQQLKQDFKAQFDNRVNLVLKALIDQAAAKKWGYKHRRFGHDPFDQVVLKRQAHRTVHQQHQQQLSRLEAREKRELQTLMSSIKQREQRHAERLGREHGKARDDFQPAIERRQGVERRRSGPSR